MEAKRITPQPHQQGPSGCLDSSNEHVEAGKIRYGDFIHALDVPPLFHPDYDAVMNAKSFLGANPVNDGFFFRIYFRDIGDFWMRDGL